MLPMKSEGARPFAPEPLAAGIFKFRKGSLKTYRSFQRSEGALSDIHSCTELRSSNRLPTTCMCVRPLATNTGTVSSKILAFSRFEPTVAIDWLILATSELPNPYQRHVI